MGCSLPAGRWLSTSVPGAGRSLQGTQHLLRGRVAFNHTAESRRRTAEISSWALCPFATSYRLLPSREFWKAPAPLRGFSRAPQSSPFRGTDCCLGLWGSFEFPASPQSPSMPAFQRHAGTRSASRCSMAFPDEVQQRSCVRPTKITYPGP